MNQSKPLTTMFRDGDTGAVVVEDIFATDAHDLWKAVTEPDRLRHWIADVSMTDRSSGAFTARFTSGWEGTGQVEVCEPVNRLQVRSTSTEGETTITEVTLTPTDQGTKLVVEERGLSLDTLHFHGAGWQVHVEDLRALLGGAEQSDWEARWHENLPDFEAMTVVDRGGSTR